MKQKIVIKVSMPCEKSRSKAMAVAAGTTGEVISMAITGDDKDRLELVGDDVDPVCLVDCLRRKLGHADIIRVEEVKDKKPKAEKPEEKPPDEPHFCPTCYHGFPPPLPMICECNEPSTCSIM